MVTNSPNAYAFFDRMFRPAGEWHMGSIYIFVANTQGVMRFHAANQSLEGRNLYDNKDRNGVCYVRELIAAAEAGGGFVEYLFDNPDVQGDEEEGSPKVSYAVALDLAGEKLLLGSGYYPALPTPVAPTVGAAGAGDPARGRSVSPLAAAIAGAAGAGTTPDRPGPGCAIIRGRAWRIPHRTPYDLCAG